MTLLFDDGEPVALFAFVVQKSEGQVEPVNVEDRGPGFVEGDVEGERMKDMEQEAFCELVGV